MMRSSRGALKPGGTIVEGTAGNTGIGLTLVANSLGFKSVIVIPDTQSQEKKDALRLYGAELIEVPAKPYKHPNNYIKVSGRLAEKLNARAAGRRRLGQPVRQHLQSPRPYRNHRT
jgi:cysteine synthase A